VSTPSAPAEPARSTGRQVTRRAVAAAGAAAVALLAAGCDGGENGDSTGGSEPSTGSDAPTTAGSPDRAVEDPDRALVRTALVDERRQLERVEASRSRHRQLRRVLAGAAAVHRSHVQLLAKALDGDDAAVDPAPAVPGSPARALRDVRAGERRLAGDHTRTAMAARSGTFAQLLAAMAAAAAQQDRVLGQAAVEGTVKGGSR
jgi:hypothetical protein